MLPLNPLNICINLNHILVEINSRNHRFMPASFVSANYELRFA